MYDFIIKYYNEKIETKGCWWLRSEYLSYLYSIYGSKIYHEDLINHIKINISGFGGDIQNYQDDVDKMISIGYNSAEEHFKIRKHIGLEKKLNEDQKDLL